MQQCTADEKSNWIADSDPNSLTNARWTNCESNDDSNREPKRQSNVTYKQSN